MGRGCLSEMSSHQTRGNAGRGRWKGQYDSVLEQQIWWDPVRTRTQMRGPWEKQGHEGCGPESESWARPRSKRRSNLKAAAEPLGAEDLHKGKLRKGQAGPQESGVPSAQGNRSRG